MQDNNNMTHTLRRLVKLALICGGVVFVSTVVFHSIRVLVSYQRVKAEARRVFIDAVEALNSSDTNAIVRLFIRSPEHNVKYFALARKSLLKLNSSNGYGISYISIDGTQRSLA